VLLRCWSRTSSIRPRKQYQVLSIWFSYLYLDTNFTNLHELKIKLLGLIFVSSYFVPACAGLKGRNNVTWSPIYLFERRLIRGRSKGLRKILTKNSIAEAIVQKMHRAIRARRFMSALHHSITPSIHQSINPFFCYFVNIEKSAYFT